MVSPRLLLLLSQLCQFLLLGRKGLVYKNQVGKKFRDIGELSLSEKIHNQVIKRARVKDYYELYIEALIDLGSVERDFGRSHVAERLYKQARIKAIEINSYDLILESQRSLAFLYLKLGRLQDVELQIKNAQQIISKVKNKKFIANFLAVCGNYYQHIGDIQQSVESYEKALAVARSIGFSQRVSTILGDIGVLYLSQGLNDPDKCRRYLVEGFEESKKANYKKSTLSILLRLADLEEKTYQNLDEAQKYYLEAQNIAQKMKFRREQADCLVGLGSIDLSRSNHEEALANFFKAKEMYDELGYKKEAAFIVEKEGDILFSQRLFMDAAVKYEAACKVNEDLHFVENLWFLHQKAGESYEFAGENIKAYRHYADAIQTIEKMRIAISDESQKLSFISRRISAYEKIVILCLKLKPNEIEELRINPLEEAFEFIERAKSRTLIDMLGNIKINIDDVVDKGLQNRRNQLEQKLDELIKDSKYNSGKNKKKVESPNFGDDSNSEYQRLYSEWQEIIEVIRRNHPEFLSLKRVDVFSVSDFRAAIDYQFEYILLDFFITQNQLIVLVVKPHDITSYVVSKDITSIRLKVKNFLQELINVSGKDQDDMLQDINKLKNIASELYEELLGKIDEYFTENSLLVIVPHGFLHNFPFSALFNNNKQLYLGEMIEIVQSPSASIFEFCREKNKRSYKSFLGIGNPEVNNELPLLPGAEEEVKNISSLFSNSKLLIRGDATDSNFYSLAQKFDIIHIACHGFFDSKIPMLSRLYFTPSDDTSGIVTAADIFNLRLSCSLVTLSACESGVSRVLLGDELMGFVRAFLYAGAPSMLVSLWPISDSATQDFMVVFYNLLLEYRSKSKAMKETIRFFNSKQESYKHPFFWAGIMLVGDNI